MPAPRTIRRWTVASLCALALGACRAPPPPMTDWSAAQRAQVDQIQRLITSRDLVSARNLFEQLAPSPGQRSLAAELEGPIAEGELEPFAPAFREVAAALEAHDNELAGRILRFAQARQPRGAALETARKFQDVIDGRELLQSMRFRLEVEASGQPDYVRVAFVAENVGTQEIELACAGAALDYLSIGLAPTGIEQRSAQRLFVDALDRISLPPGGSVRKPLGAFPAPIRGFIGVRGSWRLSAAAGALRINGRELSAQEIRVEPCEHVRLDPRLPSDALEPADLADYLRRGAPSIASLLERTVRIDVSRRAEAVELVARALVERPLLEVERAAPALRWLTGERGDGGQRDDGALWRAWLETRLAGEAPPAQRPQLELPDPSDDARPRSDDANVRRR